MAPRKQCPWCDFTGKLTKEHVWPQWLRDEVPAAQRLIAEGNPSERQVHHEPVLTVDEQGVLHHEWEKHPDLHTLLPMVTVPICDSCNNVRLNSLEREAQRILRPFLRAEAPLNIVKQDLAPLGRWALKTFMNYCLTRGTQTNPFSREEYRRFHEDNRTPDNIRLWVFTSSSRWAQVGLQIASWPITAPGAMVDVLPRDNCAQGMLALGGVVFLLAKVPSGAIPLLNTMQPPSFEGGGSPIDITVARRRPLTIQADETGEQYMDGVDIWMRLSTQIGLPLPDGISRDQLNQLDTLWREGVPRNALLPLVTPPATAADPEMRTHVREMIERANRGALLGDPTGAALLLVRAARDHFYQRDFRGAALLDQTAIELPGSPLVDDPKAFYRVGQSYWNLRDPQCVDWYRRTIDAGITDNGPHYGLVDGLTWSGRYAEALTELETIPKRTPRDRGTQLAAGQALAFLVNELGLARQTRRDLTPVEEADETLDPMNLIMNVDATSRAAWRRTPGDDPRDGFHMARAWFGDDPWSWLMGAVAVQHHRPKELVNYLALGLQQSVELSLLDDELFDVLEEAGVPVRAVHKALGRAKAPQRSMR